MTRKLFILFILLTSIITLCPSCADRGNIPISRREFESTGTLRLAIPNTPESLDPRHVRVNSTVTVMHLLYEGLMRLDYHDKLNYGVAEHVDVSDDRTTYTFRLRNAYWSNGDPLTAEDFVRSWKEAIVSASAQPATFYFDVIKGAKEHRKNKTSGTSLGLTAVDPHTLKVELEQPVPFFTKLIASHYFFPVHRTTTPLTIDVIGNGPFQLQDWDDQDMLTFVPNANYWDRENVQLGALTLSTMDNETAVKDFLFGKLDWAGSPTGMISPDQVKTLKGQKLITLYPASAVHLLRFNTAAHPFDQEKMRRAFGLAIDRKRLIFEVFKGESTPALGLVPPNYRLQPAPYYADGDLTMAWELFQSAITDMGIDKEDLPEIAICYMDTPIHRQVAEHIRSQWENAFEIPISLHPCTQYPYFKNLSEGKFGVSLGSWYADTQDPVDFLDLFQFKDNPMNGTSWEDQQYQQLLSDAQKARSVEERNAALSKAEQRLMTAMPVVPLYHPYFFSMKKNNVLGVYFSDLGYLDFKYAFIDDDDIDELISAD